MSIKKIILIIVLLFLIISSSFVFFLTTHHSDPTNKVLYSIEMKLDQYQLKFTKDKESVLYKQIKERYNNDWKGTDELTKLKVSEELLDRLEEYFGQYKDLDHLHYVMKVYKKMHDNDYITDKDWEEIQYNYLKINDPIK